MYSHLTSGSVGMLLNFPCKVASRSDVNALSMTL